MQRMITSVFVLVFFGAATGAAQAGPDCEAWNTKKFFGTATVEDVTSCLAGGADVEARDKNGSTPLHLAAEYNENPAVIEALVAAGANVREGDEDGRHPLHYVVVFNENPAVTEALLEAGADPLAQTALTHPKSN